MTREMLQQVLDKTSEEEPIIWQIAFPSLEPPSETGRFFALASLATADWLPAAVACVVPHLTDIRPLGEDGIDVNWSLVHFVAAFAARQPEPVFSALRPLLADPERRLFALEALAEISTYQALHESITIVPFLQEFEAQSVQWTDEEYESYTHALLGNGIAQALTAVEEILSRLPVAQNSKQDGLVRQIAHFRNFPAWSEAHRPAEEKRQQRKAGLRWLEKQGVLRMIQERS